MSFVAIPGRDAHATFAGLVFQVNVTILRWLKLQPDQHLELEALGDHPKAAIDYHFKTGHRETA